MSDTSQIRLRIRRATVAVLIAAVVATSLERETLEATQREGALRE